MKKLLIALLAVSSFANAKDVAYMENAGGGRIIITNDVCMDKNRTRTFEGMWRIYTYSNKGDTTEGCFAFEETTIRIYWPEYNKEKRLPIAAFTVIEK